MIVRFMIGVIRVIVAVCITVVLMLVIIVVILVRARTMLMRFEAHPLAEIEALCAFRVEERSDRRIIRQCLDRMGHPGGQVGADPKDKIGLLQRCRLGRAQRVFVRRRTGLHDQRGRADAFHHPRNQRMHGGDVHSDPWHLGMGSPPKQKGGE
jgi:hypothetical protein